MPTGKGYLSRVVADARRPTHAPSVSPGMNSRQYSSIQPPSATNNASRSSIGRPLMSKHATPAALPEKKRRGQASETSQSPPNSDIAVARQPMPLPDSPVGRASQHASVERSFDDVASGTGGDSNGTTAVAIGQENDSASVPLKQHIESPSGKGDAAAHASSERLIDSSAPQQQAQQYNVHIEETVQPVVNRAVDVQDSNARADSTAARRITQDAQNPSVREDVAYEAQAVQNISPAHDTSGEHSHQPPPVSEAEITHQKPEARMIEVPPYEHAGSEQAATNRAEPTAPQVHIGQVDVVIVSEAKAPAKTASPPASGSFSSRNYLRRL